MRKNKTMYFPYLIASALCIAIYYIMDSVRLMVIASGMEGRENVYHMLAQFNIVSGIVSLVILFYVNSFVIKRRKREFGLYAILGMEKRHISLMLCWEVLLLSLLSFAAGIACGILFSCGTHALNPFPLPGSTRPYDGPNARVGARPSKHEPGRGGVPAKALRHSTRPSLKPRI